MNTKYNEIKKCILSTTIYLIIFIIICLGYMTCGAAQQPREII